MTEIPDRVVNFGLESVDKTETPDKSVKREKEQLPQPTGYRILILPRGRDPVTKGGIQLARETIEKDRQPYGC